MKVIKVIYSQLLRPLLVKAVSDPDEIWDDNLIAAIDRFFEHSEDI